jgi:ABC-type multidrug transport system fused ATPase/permease subunit
VDAVGLGLIFPLFETALALSGARGTAPSSPPWWTNTPLADMSAESRLLVVALATVTVSLSKFALITVRNYYSSKFTADLRRYWMTQIFQNFLLAEYLDTKRQKRGVLVNNMVNEPLYASKGLHDIIDLIVNMLLCIAMGLVLLVVNWAVTAVVVALLLIVVILLWQLSARHSSQAGKVRTELNQKISHLVLESVAGARQLKVFSAEQRAIDELAAKATVLMTAVKRFQVSNTLPQAVSETAIALLLVLALLLGHFVFRLDIASLVPAATVFAGGGLRLFNAASTVFSKRMSVITYWPSIRAVERQARTLPRPPRSGLELWQGPVRRSLTLRDVHFAFDNGTKVFDGANLSFTPGRLISLAGRSGSGKSTLCDLIAKLYHPASGALLIDGKDLAELETNHWRMRIGYVSQDTFMFNSSIKDNLKVGRPAASDADIKCAAQLADAEAFIEALPQKYDTILGDGGVTLSGGQRQRLAIARALIRDPDVIIFDEATSALDIESERKILSNVGTLAHDKLVIVTTHRLHTLEVADEIIFLDKGRAIECGTYHELVGLRGSFFRLLSGEEQELSVH